MPIKLNSPGGGSVTIDVPNISTANTLTIPGITANVITSGDSNTVTQTMINRSSFFGGFGPAFLVYPSVDQTCTAGSPTKCQFNTKVFDTASCFDATTNYRFTPNVAGYYSITFSSFCASTSTITYNQFSIYKNGGSFSQSTAVAYLTAYSMGTVTSLIYMNGTTDYLEAYVAIGGAGTLYFKGGNAINSNFQGFLARPA